jgi:hypothetical protein
LLDLFYELIFEDKSFVELGQKPHQMEPVDPSQPSTVAVIDDVKSMLSETNRMRHEVDHDDNRDSKRQ